MKPCTKHYRSITVKHVLWPLVALFTGLLFWIGIALIVVWAVNHPEISTIPQPY